jgi:hypothetical protein
MGMAWIQALDVAGAILGFTALFAALLMLGKISREGNVSQRRRQRSF